MRCKADSMGESVTDAIRVTAESMGYPKLRRLQETAVRAFVIERDAFVSIPMSGGKSLCYSVLSSVFDILRRGHATVLGEHIILGHCAASVRCHAMRRNENYWLVTILRDVTLMNIPFHHENLSLVTRRSPPPINVWPRETMYMYPMTHKGVSAVLGCSVSMETTNPLTALLYSMYKQ